MKNTQLDAEAIFNRIKTLIKAKHDYEVAEYFGLSRNATSNWKKRESIPWEPIYLLSIDMGISMEFLLTGKENNDSKNSQEHSITSQEVERLYKLLDLCTAELQYKRQENDRLLQRMEALERKRSGDG